MTPLVTLPHILLVLVAAFLIGVRAFRETRPKDAVAADEDTAQLQRFAKFAGIGLVLLTLAVIFGLDLGMVHATKAIQ